MVQEEFLEDKRKKRNNPDIEISGNDWKTIKPQFNKLCRILTTVDMNVVVIARSSKNYVDSDSEMFKVDKNDPETFQSEKNTAYIFDTVIQLSLKRKSNKNIYMANVRKDRSHRLPVEEFEWQDGVLLKYFGDVIGRESKPINLEPDLVAPPVCEECGKPIESMGNFTIQEIADESIRKFGKALCRACRKPLIEKQKQDQGESQNAGGE
jgi:hypothetical protein